MIDSGYCLQKGFNPTDSTTNFLKASLLTNLNDFLSKFHALVTKLLTKSLEGVMYLWDIRLGMLITIVEDQFLLLSLLTHL